MSFSTNIAEGDGRRRSRDKAHFYVIAHSSGEELKNLLFFARDLKLGVPDRFETVMDLIDEAGRILHGLIESLGAWIDP